MCGSFVPLEDGGWPQPWSCGLVRAPKNKCGDGPGCGPVGGTLVMARGPGHHSLRGRDALTRLWEARAERPSLGREKKDLFPEIVMDTSPPFTSSASAGL